MEEVEKLISQHTGLVKEIEKLEDKQYELADKILEKAMLLDRDQLLSIYPTIKNSDMKFKLFERIRAIKGYFIADGTEEDLRFYKTKDEEYSLTIRPDGFFVLHKLNRKDDAYDWVETYFHTFEECEQYMEKSGYKPSLPI